MHISLWPDCHFRYLRLFRLLLANCHHRVIRPECIRILFLYICNLTPHTVCDVRLHSTLQYIHAEAGLLYFARSGGPSSDEPGGNFDERGGSFPWKNLRPPICMPLYSSPSCSPCTKKVDGLPICLVSGDSNLFVVYDSPSLQPLGGCLARCIERNGDRSLCVILLYLQRVLC